MAFDDIQIYIIVTSIQLGSFIILTGLALWKFFQCIQNIVQTSKLLIFLHGFLILSTIISTTMQIFQLIQQIFYSQVDLQTVMMINMYNLLAESVVIFMFAFYWKKTNDFIKNQIKNTYLSSQNTLKFQLFTVGITTFCYIGYFIYVLVYSQKTILIKYLTLYIWQTVGVILLLWGIFSQIRSGNALKQSITQCSQLIKTNVNQTRFNAVYWITSITFFIRMLFLVTVTIALVNFVQDQNYDFWAVYIYTFTDIIPILCYILSLKIRKRVLQQEQSFIPDRAISGNSASSKNSKNSRHDTQLSQQFKAQDTGIQ